MRFFLIVYFLLYIHLTYCQKWYGKVVDINNGKGLAYVNIGVVGKNTGTVSDENGNFEISLPEVNATDSLRFSICGYQTLSYLLSDLKTTFKENKISVSLQEKIYQIPEVTIRGQVTEEILGNKFGIKKMVGGFTSNQLGCELGVRINIKKSPTYIKNLNFQITYNIFDTLFFRINVYNLKDDRPYKNILSSPIYYTCTVKDGEISIDLSQYRIIVEDDYFISLEWVKNFSNKELKNGLYFPVRFGGATTFYRHASQDEWKKLSPISLRFNTLNRF